MPLSIQRKAFLAFAIALLVLATLAVASFRTLRTAIRSSAEVSRTQDIISAAGRVQQHLTDAQTGARGYLLTGSRRFLAPYDSGIMEIGRELDRLDSLVRGNAAQVARVRRLRGDALELLERQRGNVAAFDSGNTSDAIARVRSGDGERAMADVRGVVDEITGEELLRLSSRRGRAARSVNRTFFATISGFAFAFAVTLAALAALARDLRARQRIADELATALRAAEAASRAKSDFLARMSHELRTPLNSVIGFANVLLKNKRGTLDQQDVSYLTRIQSNGQQLLAIINDILDLAKVESGRVDLEIGLVDVGGLLHEILASIQPRDGVVLQASIPDDLEPLRTDRQKLRQILVNLVGNAAKFTERGRVTVRVVTRPTGEIRRIDVVDSGIGIAADRLSAIFEAFEQAEETTSRRFGGTGLGLPIARSLAERLGFRLGVVSTPGEGATFSLVTDPGEPLPSRHVAPEAAAAVVAAPPAPAPRERAAGQPRVLVIDDSSDSRLLIAQFLEDAGYHAITAASGEQGIQLALEVRPDIITLDLLMPSMDGWEVLRRLKMHPSTAEIPVVVVSVVANEERAAIMGAVDLVDKPIGREELLGAIQRNVRRGVAHVLIVEDDADARALMRAYLADFPGFTLRAASTAESALQALAERVPDVILLDLMLPDMNGVELLRRLREDPRCESVPVVVVTAKDLSPEERDQLERHSYAVLTKGMALGKRLQRVFRAVSREIQP